MAQTTVRVLDYGERGTVSIVRDGEMLAIAAAQTLLDVTNQAIAERGRATVALSGGSTPKKMSALFTGPDFRDRVQWDKIEFFWGDERWVPLSSPESNAGEALRGFLDEIGVSPSHLHVWKTDGNLTPAQAADDYVQQLKDVFGDTLPRFDLIYLGMGDDGHTASLFPGTDAINEHRDWAIAHYVEKLGVDRLTLTPPVLNNARVVVFLVGGAGKAETLHHVLDGGIDVDLLPSQVIRPVSGRLIWLVDQPAASMLERAETQGGSR